MEWDVIYQITKPLVEANQTLYSIVGIVMGIFVTAVITAITVAAIKQKKIASQQFLALLPVIIIVSYLAYTLPIVYSDPYTIQGTVKDKITWESHGDNYGLVVEVKNSQFYGENGLGEKKTDLIGTAIRIEVPKPIFDKTAIQEEVLLLLVSDVHVRMLGKIANSQLEIFENTKQQESVLIDLSAYGEK